MKILYIHQYFNTPSQAGGNRSYWVAKKMIEEGHEVFMLTTSSSNAKFIEKKIIDGINVIYLKIDYSQKMNIISRSLSFFKFMIYSTIVALKMKNINLVYATSTPLTVGFPALILKKIKKIPYIFEVRDLWPEVPIQMEAIKNKFLIYILNKFESIIYNNASKIIALSPGMEDGVLKKYFNKNNVNMIPNMAKNDIFYERKKDLKLLKKLNLKKNSLKLIHFGSIGLTNGIQTILRSAKYSSLLNVEYIFVGEGSELKKMINYCNKNTIENVHFLGSFSMNETSEIVNLCDISIISFLDLPILYTNSPNKFFDSLSAGKPIIVNSNGWTRDIVEKYQCGLYVNPNKPIELVQKIEKFIDNRDLLNKMGKLSRKLAEEKYDKEILCSEIIDVVNTINCE